MYPHREPNERKGPASLAGNCRRLGDARAGCGKKGKGSPPLTNLYPAPPSAAAGLPSHRALTSMRVREVGPVGCLQAVHELLECMRQPFGLIRRPYRHRRRQFPGVRPRRHANARCRRVQGDHARPWRRPEVDGLTPAAALDKVQGRAGNRECREHDHQQSESVIDVGNGRGRRFWPGLCRLPTLLLSCAMSRRCVAVPGRAVRDGDGRIGHSLGRCIA